MKYQIRMIVEVDESDNPNSFFQLENWIYALPEELGDLIDSGIALTKRETLNKEGSWE